MYSQNDEEQHILRVLGLTGSSEYVGERFLEIGAYNPKLFSNTRALYERGWSGVMVEPAPGPFLDLMIEYGQCDRIELVCAAVGTQRALVKFHHSEAGVGTSNDAHYQKWRDTALYEGTFFAAQVTMFDVLARFGVDFDFVNIDVEGGSAELFMDTLSHSNLKPKCFCVEHDGRHMEMNRLALMKGYTVEHTNGENVIYGRQNGY